MDAMLSTLAGMSSEEVMDLATPLREFQFQLIYGTISPKIKFCLYNFNLL